MTKTVALLGVLGLALLVISVVPWPSAAPAPATPAATQPAGASDADYGRALFAAKGCAGCHRHDEVPGSGEFGGNDVPELTDYAADPDFLRVWLKDPKSVRANTRMPNLGLSQAEIEALIVFLSAP